MISGYLVHITENNEVKQGVNFLLIKTELQEQICVGFYSNFIHRK